MKAAHLLMALVLPALLLPALLVVGCKRKPTEPQRHTPAVKKTIPSKPKPEALPEDKAYGSGAVQAAVVKLQTMVQVPGMEPAKDETAPVRKARESSVLNQDVLVSDDRGKAVFTTDNYYIPRGTELRYNPGQKQYVLCDPDKKTYWAMTGSEVGNLLEGGPTVTRINYTLDIKDSEEKQTIAGVEAMLSNAELGFDWSVKTRTGSKKGNLKVKLAIWHSKDGKLKPAWGQMMVDFLTMPFQDTEGQKVVAQLKQRISFPVQWIMEVIEQGPDKQVKQDRAPPKLTTLAQTLEIKEIPRPQLASPPAGYGPASGPYEFAEGGQTVSPSVLSQIPSRPGKPPVTMEEK